MKTEIHCRQHPYCHHRSFSVKRAFSDDQLLCMTVAVLCSNIIGTKHFHANSSDRHYRHIIPVTTLFNCYTSPSPRRHGLLRPVYESLSCTSMEVYETSHKNIMLNGQSQCRLYQHWGPGHTPAERGSLLESIYRVSRTVDL